MDSKKRKKQTRILPILTVIVLIAAIVCTALYFGYDKYIKYTHPIKYENYVVRYAAQNNIDKYLVYAVIKTESGYDSNAVSNVGARGLMQIMEPTFEWIKFKMGDDETEYYDMFDPETNIRYGCYLLGYLYQEFGNVQATMAAYHAGRGQVNEWLADKNFSTNGRTLDYIPISDTAHYVDKIINSISVYKELYA